MVLMRGHGVTVVGNTLRQAVFRAVYTEVGARLQAEASRLGPVTFLTPGEAVPPPAPTTRRSIGRGVYGGRVRARRKAATFAVHRRPRP